MQRSQYLLLQDLTMSITASLEAKWNAKLTRSPDNPFPLAPPQLVDMGLLNDEIYEDENDRLKGFCSWNMLRQIINIKAQMEPGLYGLILEVWGPGLARDLGFVPCAAAYSFHVIIRDNSGVACDIANEYIEVHLPQNDLGRVDVIQCDVNKIWHEVDQANTYIIYLAQCFIQVQNKRTMQRIMRRLGAFLSREPGKGMPKRRVFFVTARKEDNNAPADWRGSHFPTVKWGDTTLYDDNDLLAPAHEGYSGNSRLELTVIQRHNYYHQHYALMCLMEA